MINSIIFHLDLAFYNFHTIEYLWVKFQVVLGIFSPSRVKERSHFRIFLYFLGFWSHVHHSKAEKVLYHSSRWFVPAICNVKRLFRTKLRMFSINFLKYNKMWRHCDCFIFLLILTNQKVRTKNSITLPKITQSLTNF